MGTTSRDSETHVRAPEVGPTTLNLSNPPSAAPAPATVKIERDEGARGDPGEPAPLAGAARTVVLAVGGEAPCRRFGRYLMFGPLATGGMASVHYGVVCADDGTFSPVALKRVRASLNSPEYAAMLADEARIAASVRHPNVVGTLDLIALEGGTMLALEYVAGTSLSQAMKSSLARGERIPVAVAATIVVDVLRGLAAVHDAHDTFGRPLEIVHRDVSPQNILLDERGAARIADFGVATARGRLQRPTETGALKGKLGYLAPEQVHGQATRAVDIYACGVVLWEMLCGRPLFEGTDEEILAATLLGKFESPSAGCASVPPALDAIVMKALARKPEERYASANAMADAIAAILPPSAAELASWLGTIAGEELAQRRAAVRQMLARAARESELAASLVAPGRVDATPDIAASSTRSRAWLVVPFMLLSLAALGLAVRSRVAPDVASNNAGTFASPAVLGDPAGPGAATISIPASAPSPGDSSSALPASSEVGPAAPSTTPSAPKTPRPLPQGRSRPASSAKSIDCSMPYVFDAEGRMIWRRECFKK